MADNVTTPQPNVNEKAMININNTSYYIMEDWFEITRKYFNINSDDVESISMLKTGLFGYNSEIQSNEFKNNIYHRNILYDEHFLNTASFPESVYNFAKTFNYDVDFARPSHCRINFAIAKDDLINNKFREEIEVETGSIINKRVTYKLVLNNDYIFLLDNVQFRLPYPVIVNFKETADKTDFSLSAYYDMTASDFPYLILNNQYIKLWQDYDNGKKIVYFGLDLFQINLDEKELNIVSQDVTDNLFYDFNFSDQLAYFEVFHDYNGEITRLGTYFNNTYQPDNEEEFCYYSIIDNSILQISFSAIAGSFRPSLNSVLRVKMYTTKGSAGNFSYIGHRIGVNFNNNGAFDKVPVSIIPITECSGGLNLPNYTTVKNGIIDKFAVRDNLIIDNDLDVHFRKVNETESVYNSKIEWIKKRNDVLKRLHIAYLAVRDKDRKILPTNTADTLLVTSEYFRANNFSIKENTRIFYDIEKNQYIIGDDLAKDTSKYLVYRFPFLMSVISDPILIGNYYSTYTDSNVNMLFKYINPHIDDNFSLKELTVYKDNVNSTKYTISVDMNSTYHSVDSEYIKLRCIICDSYGKEYGFIELAPQKNKDDAIINKFYFEGYLEINQDLIIENNKIIISQMYNCSGGAQPSDIINNIPIENNISLQLGILIKSEETNYKTEIFNKMKDIDLYTTAIVYESDNNTEIFLNMYKYMESDVRTPNEMKKKLGEEEYKKQYGENNYYFIKQFPIVEEIYFLNLHKNFFDIWKVYVDIVRDAINYLENNTSVDIKLANTYGKSHFYYSDFTYDEEGKIVYDYIDNIHLDINMKIYLNYYITEDTDNAIKKYVSDFLESCNDAKLFPISNLITKLESNFEIIKFIEFFKIGDNTTQKIKSSFTSLLDMTKEEIEDYVPEYLNVKKKLDLSQKKFIEVIDPDGNKVLVEDVDHNKTLSYPYNFNINLTYLY